MPFVAFGKVWAAFLATFVTVDKSMSAMRRNLYDKDSPWHE